MRTPILAIAAAILALGLLAACAATGSGERNYDEALLDCRAKADSTGKARYTRQWQEVVDQCMQENQKQ